MQKYRRVLMFVFLAWGIAMLFIPVRKETISGFYKGDTPDTRIFVEQHQVDYSSVALGFSGHTGGIFALAFFMLMPFFIFAEAGSFKRPFSLPARAFLQLQALLLFLGAPYCFYIATFEGGYYYDAVHSTTLAAGGWILFAQNIIFGAFLFSALGFPNGKTASLFGSRMKEA
ncbi:MAG TPA: hypothetical protein VFU15_16710 [Bacteroidia bacterium]|nr:hypothetical protein [Bacteroidia bacterium]